MTMQEDDKKIEDMTDEDWKNKLTQEQYEVCREKGMKCHFQENTIIQRTKEFTNVSAVVMNYSNQIQSLIQGQVGRVSINR